MSTNKEAVTKSWKDVEATHKAHKEAAFGVHGLKDDASKDDVKKAFKSLEAAHKAHKDACDAHKEECHKAILGAAKEDRAKMGFGELQKLDTEDMRYHLAGQDRSRGFVPPSDGASLQKALDRQSLQDALDSRQKTLDPADPLFDMKKAMRTPLTTSKPVASLTGR